MNEEMIHLFVWIAISLAIATISAFLFRHSRIWDWIDPPYYLLGIAGVAFLFQGQANDREYLRLRDERAPQLSALNAASASLSKTFATVRDPIDNIRLNTLSLPNTINARIENTNEDFCSTLFKDATCTEFFKSEVSYQAAEKQFSTRPRSNDFGARLSYDHKLCDALPAFINPEKLNDKDLESIFSSARSLSLAPPYLGTAPDESARRHLTEQILHRTAARRAKKDLGLTDDAGNDVSQETYDSTVDEVAAYAAGVALDVRYCTSTIKASETMYDRLDALARRVHIEQNKLNALNEKIRLAKSRVDISDSDASFDKFTTGSWPYILVLAAALKFAKAMASISTDVLQFSETLWSKAFRGGARRVRSADKENSDDEQRDL